MLSSIYHTIASGAVMLVAVASMHAQGTSDSGDQTLPTHSVCGYQVFNDGGERLALENTARRNPALYQRLLERAKHPHGQSLQSAGGGISWVFIVRNRVTTEYDEVNAHLVYLGIRARIWLDDKDSVLVKQATINALARGLDTITPGASRNKNESIINNDEDVFGKPPANKLDPSTPDVEDFLLTDIKDSITGAYVAGFFSPWDQSQSPGSNQMNLLYIDSHEGLRSGLTEVLNTMAHEYQHLIHYNHNNHSEIVFNEGCSEVASILNGYQSRANSNYLRNVNLPMFMWNYTDGGKILIDYERAMTVVHYLYEQCGERFLTAFTQAQSPGMDRVAEALRQIGDNRDWRHLLSDYVAANYLGASFSQPYGYHDRLSTSAATVQQAFSNGQFPDTGSYYVEQYAGAYINYLKPGPVTVKFHASQPIRVMAMLFRGTPAVPVEVWELENDSTYTIGNYAAYDKVVFGIANLSNNGQSVRWNINKLTLGVDDATASAAGVAIDDVTPNPVTGPAVISFHVPTAGDVTAQLFDTRGVMVRTVAQAARFEAGDHTIGFSADGLASGAYLLRVTQGSKSSVREVMIVR